MEATLDLNDRLLLWINQGWANPIFDQFFYWISQKYTFSFPLLFAVWIALGIKFGKRGWLLGGLMLLVTATGDAFGNMLKHYFQHPRPCLLMHDMIRMHYTENTQCLTSTTGMPSNHSLNFFSTFCFLSFFIRIRWVIIASLTLATLVAISRVYLALHYPAQIAAGTLIGCIYGISIAWLCRYYLKDKLPMISS